MAKPSDSARQHWRTKMDRQHLAHFGVEEMHVVFFTSVVDPGGPGMAVMVMIPETPPRQIADALTQADNLKARIAFLCDTQQQANDVANATAHALKDHKRVPYESAVEGIWGAINQN